VKRSSPATARNREPIAAVLRDVLPPEGLVLEVASGAGEHAVHFARRFDTIVWQPSDPDPDALSSIEAHVADAGLSNVREPVELDAASDSWPVDAADAILCINMVHISPWSACVGLMRGAGRCWTAAARWSSTALTAETGSPPLPAMRHFDRSLKERDPAWGLRRLEDVGAEAERAGLALERVVEMPANNLVAVFRRSTSR
jgi:hypothetical protein